MAERKKAREKFVSPVGITRYCFLSVPQVHEEYAPQGVYKTELIVPYEQAKPLMDKIDGILEGQYQELLKKSKPEKRKSAKKHYPYVEEYDEGEQPTGNIIFRFKLPAKVLSKKTGKVYEFKPGLFDAQKKPIDPAKVSIFSGSTVRISYSFNPFANTGLNAAGVSLQLEAAQVLNLVSGRGGSAESFGFDEEDGYVVDDTEATDFDAVDSTVGDEEGTHPGQF